MSSVSKTVTPEELSSVSSQLCKLGYSLEGIGYRKLAKVLNVSERRARVYKKSLGNSLKCNLTSEQEVKGDTWTISLPKTRVNTVEELLKHFKVDTQVWQVDRFVVNAWDMGSVPNGEPVVTQLYQVKAYLRRIPAIANAKAEIASLKEYAKKDAKLYKPVKYVTSKTGNMLEVQIPDLHLGKMAWGVETNGDNYDSHIAEEVFDKAVEALVDRTSSYNFDRTLFLVGNDLLHTDTRAGTTEAGTPVDTDGRYHKSFIKARKMITRAIERLMLISPVDVLVVPGNHDTLSAWHLGDSLECTFAKCKDVTIDNTPNHRKYYQWGDVMLMFAHGNKGKLQDYPLTMATERPDLWGATKFREAHTGDKHQLKVQELHGCRVRISPALCPADAWHSENYFIGNQRAAEAFVWSKTEGLIGTAVYTV